MSRLLPAVCVLACLASGCLLSFDTCQTDQDCNPGVSCQSGVCVAEPSAATTGGSGNPGSTGTSGTCIANDNPLMPCASNAQCCSDSCVGGVCTPPLDSSIGAPAASGPSGVGGNGTTGTTGTSATSGTTGGVGGTDCTSCPVGDECAPGFSCVTLTLSDGGPSLPICGQNPDPVTTLCPSADFTIISLSGSTCLNLALVACAGLIAPGVGASCTSCTQQSQCSLGSVCGSKAGESHDFCLPLTLSDAGCPESGTVTPAVTPVALQSASGPACAAACP